MIKQTHVLLFSESCVVATATNPVVPQLHALDSNLLEHSQGVVVGSWTAPIPCGVCTVRRGSDQSFFLRAVVPVGHSQPWGMLWLVLLSLGLPACTPGSRVGVWGGSGCEARWSTMCFWSVGRL